MEQKAEKGKIIPFFPILLLEIEQVSSFSPSPQFGFTPPAPRGSQAFRVGLNYTTVSPGFVACSQEIVEFLSLHK